MNRRPSPLLACGPAVKEQAKNPRDFPKVLRRTRQHSRGDRGKDKKTRFAELAFRRAVRQVIEYLGEEPSFENFIKYDRIVDWEAFAESMNHPTRVALCHVLDSQGQEVTLGGTPVVVAREIAACSESEAAEILLRESKVFVKWWQ